MGREQGATRVFKLKSSSRLPSQKLMLTVTANTKHLIDCIVVDLEIHKDDFIPCSHILIVTGSDHVPVHIGWGTVIRCQDMRTTQEEADTILIEQVSLVSYLVKSCMSQVTTHGI